MKLPKIAISNYQFTIIAFILITIAGLNSYLNMPRMENPEIDIPGASVVVIYPGTNPVDMEQLVVTPIEDALNELDDIKSIETNINNGLAIIHIEFYFGTDADKKFDDVVEKVNTVRNDLPGEIYDLNVQQWSISDVCMMQLALVSDSVEYRVLQKKAEKLSRKLTTGEIKTEYFVKDEKHYRQLYMSTQSPIAENIKIVYSLGNHDSNSSFNDNFLYELPKNFVKIKI